jgi:hypothetical protein
MDLLSLISDGNADNIEALSSLKNLVSNKTQGGEPLTGIGSYDNKLDSVMMPSNLIFDDQKIGFQLDNIKKRTQNLMQGGARSSRRSETSVYRTDRNAYSPTSMKQSETSSDDNYKFFNGGSVTSPYGDPDTEINSVTESTISFKPAIKRTAKNKKLQRKFKTMDYDDDDDDESIFTESTVYED